MQFDCFKIGEVSSIDPSTCTARVIFDDENSMVSYDMPVMQRNSYGNKDYQMPDIGEDVLCLFRGGGFEDGVIIGSFYAGEVAPPETTADRRTVVFKDGTRICYDRKEHTLTVTIAGTQIIFDRQKGSITVPDSVTVNCKSSTTNCETAVVKASKTVTLDTPDTIVTGNLSVAGLISGAGGMSVTGGGGVVANCDIALNGTMAATGDVTASGISLNSHTHTGVHGETSGPH